MITSQYFTDDEFICNCGKCKKDVTNDVKFIAHMVRVKTGRAYVNTSGARCAYWNEHEKGSPTSSHLKGLASDVKFFDSQHKFAIIKALIELGVTRIGINEDYMFIHWDIDPDKPQNTLFKY